MITELATPITLAAPTVRRRVMPTLAAGVLGGFALGIFARAWMRLISEDPGFTWSGTLFIVIGFTIFGLTQSIVAAARRSATRRSKLTVLRVIGVAGMLPLFVAAGAVMFPTVIGGGLAVARVEWRRVTRGVCLFLAALPVAFVGNGLVGSFGWSLHSAGFLAMLAVYAAIIGATRFTFSRQDDGWRSRRSRKIIIVTVLGLLLLIPLAAGGIK